MKITPDIVDKHGLKINEYKKIISLIGKEPNLLELGIFPQCGMSIAHINLQKNI